VLLTSEFTILDAEQSDTLNTEGAALKVDRDTANTTSEPGAACMGRKQYETKGN